MTPTIDLVLATRGRADEPERLLESLALQRFHDFRLIVADQNDAGVLDPLLARFRAQFPIVHLRVPGSGLSRSRNAAQEHVEAEVVGFPDDDCRYPPGLLQAVDEHFSADPSLGGLACRTVDENGASTVLRWDRGPGPVTRRSIFRRTISTATFLRRRVLETVGPWDETLGVGAGTAWGSGEETDYYLRALEAGFTIDYEPALGIVHDSPAPAFGDREVMTKAYGYGRAHSEVLRRHGYPMSYRAWRAAQLLGGSSLLLVSGDPGRARFYWNMGRGRLRGLS